MYRTKVTFWGLATPGHYKPPDQLIEGAFPLHICAKGLDALDVVITRVSMALDASFEPHLSEEAWSERLDDFKPWVTSMSQGSLSIELAISVDPSLLLPLIGQLIRGWKLKEQEAVLDNLHKELRNELDLLRDLRAEFSDEEETNDPS